MTSLFRLQSPLYKYVFRLAFEGNDKISQRIIPVERICLSTSCTTKRSITSTSKDGVETEEQAELFSDDSDSEIAIEKICDVSRLPINMYKQYHGSPPNMTYKDKMHRQQRFAKFGKSSGEDPRIMWPSRQDILDMEAEEQEENNLTLIERLAQIKADKQTTEDEKIARRKLIENNMAQMPKWIEEYKRKQLDAKKAEQERAGKKEALLEEAREHFGYKIKANDPKFHQMLEEKEEKEKQEAKKRKKEEKAKKLAAKMVQEITRGQQSESKT